MSHIIARFNNMSILWKVAVSYMCIILSIVFYSYYNQYRSMVQSIEDSYGNLLKAYISNIVYDLDKKQSEMVSKIDTLTNNVVLKKYLEFYEIDPEEYYSFLFSSLGSYLSEFNARNSLIHSIRIYKYNKVVPTYGGIIQNIDLIEQEKWYRDIQNMGMFETIFIGPYKLDPAKNTRDQGAKDVVVLSAYSRIPDVNLHSHLGIAEINVQVSDFFDIVSHLDNNGIQVLIKDRLGDIIINSGIADEIISSLDTPELRNSHPSKKKLHGDNYIVVSTKVTNLDLTIILVYPYQLITPIIKESLYPFFTTFFLIILSIFAITFLISSLIFRRLNKLLRIMKEVENGNFGIYLEPDYMDEIGHIKIAFNKMIQKIDNLINSVYKTQLAEKEALLSYLTAQMDPHFLLNSLEVVRMMSEISGDKKVSEALYSLSNVYRSRIRPSSFTTLEKELELAESYLYVQNIRNNNRIKYISRVGNELKKMKIPSLILQPLVENAIKHGFSRKSDNFTIIISAAITANEICIKVTDNGKGISPERLETVNYSLEKGITADIQESVNNGIALHNINKRIKLYFGDQYHITVDSDPGNGTEVSINLPYQCTDLSE